MFTLIGSLSRRSSLDPPQGSAHSRKQFARFEGFGKTIVRIDLKTGDAVRALRHRRQEKDRSGHGCTKLLAYADTILARHHDIENDKVDASRPSILRRI